jgi:hypothetical protein
VEAVPAPSVGQSKDGLILVLVSSASIIDQKGIVHRQKTNRQGLSIAIVLRLFTARRSGT